MSERPSDDLLITWMARVENNAPIHATPRELWALCEELRQRRAADLSADEREALEWFHERAEPRLDIGSDNDNSCEHCIKGTRAIAVLAKLTRGEK